MKFAAGIRNSAHYGRILHTQEEGLAKADAAFVSAARNQKCRDRAGGERSRLPRKARCEQSRPLERMDKLSKTAAFRKSRCYSYQLESAESEKDLSVAQRTLEQVKLELSKCKPSTRACPRRKRRRDRKVKMRLAALQRTCKTRTKPRSRFGHHMPAWSFRSRSKTREASCKMGRSFASSRRADAKPRARLTFGEAGLPKLASGQTRPPFLRRVSLSALWRRQRHGWTGLAPSAVSYRRMARISSRWPP